VRTTLDGPNASKRIRSSATFSAQPVVQLAHEGGRPAQVEVVVVERQDALELRDVDAARAVALRAAVEAVQRHARIGVCETRELGGKRPVGRVAHRARTPRGATRCRRPAHVAASPSSA
jgi:hypothetical protein